MAGCSGASPAPSASPSALPKTTLTLCSVDGLTADCGYVWVPQDWAHPGGAKMALRVVVLLATGTSHPGAPLFYLAGFGTAATDAGQLVQAAQMFGQLNQTMDLVFLDQRGTPGSGAETCPGIGPPVTGPALRAAVSRCLASAGRDPRHDTTVSAVRDLDQARKALGYDQINIFGGSYGVTTGLAYLQRYGAHVRTAVFLSGSLLNTPAWQLQPIHAQQAFDQLAVRCAATPACNRSYHPAADLAAIVARLRAHPARITFPGPGGQPETATITLTGFLSFVESTYLDAPDTTVLLPEDLHALARGQWAQVFAERGLAAAAQAGQTVQLNTITIQCSDAWAAMNPAQMSPAGSFPFAALQAEKAAWQQQICALWPHDPGVSGVVRSTVPVVFINGTADPTDPPANVAAAPQTMPNALLVSAPGGTHNPVSAACLSTQITAFIQAGKPANHASWAACALLLGQALPPFPAP